MPNALAHESSPYLRQHQDNPVAWLPWGPEAFTQAKLRNLPVLVSIGYSTCHWCHVMAHECFEDPATAALMNEHLVCIKVDREEHPEVDAIYMDALQALTGHGGWPLNAFTDQAGRPFHACTYMPRPAWQGLVRHLDRLWRSDPMKIADAAGEITAHLQDQPVNPGPFPADIWQRLDDQLARTFDREHPGYAWNAQRAPKFPANQLLPLLLGSGHPAWEQQAQAVLEAMQDSGLHERVGGGFHRYSVDRQWRVPHFEKMLYDNAQLIVAFALGAHRFGRDDFLATAIAAGDYILRDLQITNGKRVLGYASAEDADDPQGEGSFYAWSPESLRAILPTPTADELIRFWDLAPGQRAAGAHGHDEPVAEHIPHPRGSAAWQGLTSAQRLQLRAAWQSHLPGLRAVRAQRPRPGRDDKVLTDQNALALEAFSLLGRVSGQERFISASRELASLLLDRQTRAGLLRLDHLPAYITDYAFLIVGLCAAFDLLGDPALIHGAIRIATEAVERLRAADGGFFTTPEGRNDLVRRGREQTDNAWPSGQNALALGFIRLFHITGEERWKAQAEGIFACCAQVVAQAPSSCATLLQAWLSSQRPSVVVVVAGPLEDPLTKELLSISRRSPLCDVIIPVASCAQEKWPSLTQRQGLTRPQALLCLEESCLAPAFLGTQLEQRLVEASTRRNSHPLPIRP